MKLEKLNLKGKGELLNEFELKEIKGGYYETGTCTGESYTCSSESWRKCNGTNKCIPIFTGAIIECRCSQY